VNFRLTPELERLIQDKIASGRFADAGAVVREALRVFAASDHTHDDRLAHLRAALANGVEQADRGELMDGAMVVRELRESLQTRRGPTRPAE